MRESGNQVINGRLMNGFDYDKQAWVVNGRYIRCGHPIGLDCKCYGTLHTGEETTTAEFDSYHTDRGFPTKNGSLG